MPDKDFNLIEDTGKGFKTKEGWSGKDIKENDKEETTKENNEESEEKPEEDNNKKDGNEDG
jgi:hypothetical protein